ncbi:MAG: M23 family metallopeptidase [Candidatus Saccharicenans sp.]
MSSGARSCKRLKELRKIRSLLKILLLLILFFPNCPFILSARATEVQTIVARSGDTFELRYRSLQPGEPLILFWNNKVSDYVNIFFLENFYQLKKEAERKQFLILGLDLMVKPGPKNLQLELWSDGQEVEKIDLSLNVLAKEFPKIKLKVDQKYVTPPKEFQERIKREAELLDHIYSITRPEWLAEGSFISPCEGKLFPNFGQQRIYNNVPRSVHSGVDIAVPFGHPIKAANSGLVVLASELYFSGKTVIIDHGLGLFSSYSHLSRLLVKRAEKVKAGQVIGLAGSTGLSTGPHLHWAIRINKIRVDPLALMELEF